MSKIIKGIGFALLLFLLSGCNQPDLIIPPTSGGDSSTIQQNNQQNSNIGPTKKMQSTVDVSGLNSKVQTQELVARIPFPVDEYKKLPKSGNSTVRGTLYVVNAQGERIVGKRTRLYLNPVTSYSRQWYKESYLAGRKMGKADSRLFNYLRFSTSDTNGHFNFYNVPAGRYYLIGVVRCGQECGYNTIHNIRVTKEISVGKKDLVIIDLNKQL